MNILFYHKCIINPTSGGISKITHTLSKVFEEYGHTVYFLAENIKYPCVCNKRQIVLPEIDLLSEKNISFFFEIIKDYRIDVVINQYAMSSQTTRFFNLCKQHGRFKLISCFHNSILTPIYNIDLQKEYVLKRRHLTLLYYALCTRFMKCIIERIYIRKHRAHYRQAVHISDANVSLCCGLQTELLKMTGEKESQKYFIIPNCVENKTAEIPQKQNVILWVGTFDNTTKRPDVILDVWSRIVHRHQEWNLVFLGDGPSFEEMKHRVELNKIANVCFEGRVNPEEYYRKAKILCVTSTHESFSLVTVEAKRNGVVPLVMNTFPAASLVVKNGIDGVLVDSYDKDRYAQELERLMSDDKALKKMSEAGISSREEFSTNSIYSLWSNLFFELHLAQ